MKYFFRLSLITCILFFTQFSNSQAPPHDIPNIFPASPEASTLGQFGDIPVNSSVGMANFSVPIYSIEEEGVQLPVSLSYQYNGLVVDQIPGHLGLGWSLNGGGMITRQVRGRADEDDSGYIGVNMIGANQIRPYLNGDFDADAKHVIEELLTDGIIDGQPDKFIVSAGNMNASFYFDENRNPIIKPYKPYIIEVINNDFSFNQGIKVTDDQGVQYFFQEIEETKQIGPIDSQGETIAGFFLGYTSAWKLSKIITINNKIIEFSYDTNIYYQGTTTQSFSQNLSNNCGTIGTTSARHFKITSKIIKDITFPKGKLEFSNTIATHSDAITMRNKFLSYTDKIELKNNEDITIKSFDLYFDDVLKTRKLLNKVKINNDESNIYEFEYYGTPPDDIHFSQQDFWGYYNTNPTNFLVNSLNSHDIYGGRKPTFEKAVLGALKTIQYPTKGSTELVYESNTFNPEGVDDVPYNCQAAELNATTSKLVTLNWLEQDQGTHSKTDEVEFTIEAPFVYVDVNLKVQKISDTDCQGGPLGAGNGVSGRVEAKLYRVDGGLIACQNLPCYGSDLPSNGCETVTISLGGALHCSPGEETFVNRLKLLPGTYKVILEVDNTINGNVLPYDVGDILKSSTTISTYANDGTPLTSVETGGVRISKMINCPNSTTNNCIEKEFIYETDNGESEGKLFRKRNIFFYEYTQSIVGGCSGLYRVYSSSSNVPLGVYMGSHVFYNKVTERTKGTDGTYLGRTEKRFIFGQVQQNLTYPFISIDNREYINGKPLSEKMYNNTSPTPIIEREYEYDFSTETLNGINQEVFSLTAGLLSISIGGIGQTKTFGVNVTSFNNSNDHDWLKVIKTKEVLNGIELEKSTNYEYSNPEGHLKQEGFTDSEGDITQKNYLYPYNINSNITNTLDNLNRKATPIQIQSSKNNNVLSTLYTEYKDWGNNIIKPEFIKSLKGESSATNQLENRLVYYNYDELGNPLEISQTNNKHLVYIWGYNKQYPIAKIENATYTDVSSFVNNIQALSNTDNDRTLHYLGNEGALRQALNNLRNEPSLSEALITTFTYDPLVGVTSITNPQGITIYYEYDEHNRLKQLKDQDGNILSKNEYNYNQN